MPGTTYSYDNNGNLTTARQWTYAWDYRNRLTSAGNGLATTTFGYDHNDQRVWKKTSTATTTYAGKFFQKTLTPQRSDDNCDDHLIHLREG